MRMCALSLNTTLLTYSYFYRVCPVWTRVSKSRSEPGQWRTPDSSTNTLEPRLSFCSRSHQPRKRGDVLRSTLWAYSPRCPFKDFLAGITVIGDGKFHTNLLATSYRPGASLP